MSPQVLLLSYCPGHATHNARVEQLLTGTFQVEHLILYDSDTPISSKPRIRFFLSWAANIASVPLIAVLVRVSQLRKRRFGRTEANRELLGRIEDYLSASGSSFSLILGFNRTLRNQKRQLEQVEGILRLAKDISVSLLILPEDNNFYASGLLIQSAQKRGIKVVIVDYTAGKESEFKESADTMLLDMTLGSYEKFALNFLANSALQRWQESRKYLNVFPGSNDTSSHSSLRPSFTSGMADFYLTSHINELDYLKRKANPNAIVDLIQPVELSLYRTKSDFPASRNVFGLFLPPNQLTNTRVQQRVSKNTNASYEELIFEIVEQASTVCEPHEELVIFPHPRMYIDHKDLLARLPREITVSADFTEYLGVMKFALIFSSAVFTPLLSAGVRVFNLDIYQYNYVGVFPDSDKEFIQIPVIQSIQNHNKSSGSQTKDKQISRVTLNEFLIKYL